MSALRFVDRPSPNFDARTRAIDLVVLHYTGMQDGETALRRLTDPAPVVGKYPGPWADKTAAPDAPLARVSAHYVVGEDGVIYRIVPEQSRAWHAGRFKLAGRGRRQFARHRRRDRQWRPRFWAARLSKCAD